MFTVTENKILFDKGLIIEEGKIKSSVHQKTFTRQRIKRDDASAVLMLNTDTNNIILTRQFRYATESKISGQLFEIVAGKVDYNEQPLETAIREAKEETGYNISPNNIYYSPAFHRLDIARSVSLFISLPLKIQIKQDQGAVTLKKMNLSK